MVVALRRAAGRWWFSLNKMAEELNVMMEKLKFSETEQEKVICERRVETDMMGYEA